ncbi:hypothetical protein Hypma_007298 [Hypsizygus marmoreus]|uniref:Uncharacterized protein n=1 Tax=Hypsizygus marmoreus TaxID=39966 RepID=A0A369KHS1_HYPMA|nr:hypothetical protein Hypma_007298 [Hypsizygus marmoreus]
MPRDNIPSIAIIEDSTSNVVDNTQTDAGSYLPMFPVHQQPPTRVMIRRSVHFNTSTALQDNNPEDPSSHLRKASNATFNSVSTIPDSNNAAELREQRTMDSGITTLPSEGHAQDEKKKGKKGREEDDEPKLTTHQFELEQDQNTDPAPFAFCPYELTHMLDPKNMDARTQYGGTEGC